MGQQTEVEFAEWTYRRRVAQSDSDLEAVMHVSLVFFDMPRLLKRSPQLQATHSIDMSS